MKIEPQATAQAIMEELGRRIAHRRLDLGMTQAEAAGQAGVGKRTVERIENGKDAQMSTLIRLLRVLDLVDGLNQLVPEAGPRPMELLKLKGKTRQRASSRRTHRPNSAWQWGERQ